MQTFRFSWPIFNLYTSTGYIFSKMVQLQSVATKLRSQHSTSSYHTCTHARAVKHTGIHWPTHTREHKRLVHEQSVTWVSHCSWWRTFLPPDNCPFGDQPGLVFNNQTCAQMVSSYSGYCYQDVVLSRCCRSCANYYIGLQSKDCITLSVCQHSSFCTIFLSFLCMGLGGDEGESFSLTWPDLSCYTMLYELQMALHCRWCAFL